MIDDANLLAGFMACLEPHRIDTAPQALLSLCGTHDVDGWRRRHALRPTAERIAIRVANQDQALWQGPYCGVRILLGGPMRIELVLPPEFGSMETMRSYLRHRGKSFFEYIFRLRATLLTICDMLLADRAALTLALRARLGKLPASLWFRVSSEDGCRDPGIVTTSRDAGATNIIIPDCYYYESDGYAVHQETVACASLPWVRRSSLAFWRGTTTGGTFTADDLERNERIRLAAACASRPDLFDVKISNIAQVPEASVPLVRARLEERGLFAASVPIEVFSRYKFALHIDGNASAASFFEKFSLACCVLRVAGCFEAWFEPRIAPWEHFVPIAEDLHDLIETTELLTRTPALAERIAQAGYAFAVEASFAHEARQFCRSLVAAVDDPETIRVDYPLAATRDVLPDEAAIRHTARPSEPHDTTLRLVAPTAEASPEWHALETLKAIVWRWSAGERLTWRIRLPENLPCTVRIEIPYVNEIEPGFAAASVIEAAGRRYPVTIGERTIVARVALDEAFDGALHLVTRAPQKAGGADTRYLGVAISTR